MQAYFPLRLPAEAMGKTRRAVKAKITFVSRGADRSIDCTVPANTAAKRVHGIWYVADLTWLAGVLNISPELVTTAIEYHGANRFGIELNSADVKEVKL